MESTTKPNYITFMRNDRATATTNPVTATVTNINKTNTYEQQSKKYHHNNNNNFNHLAHNHNNHQHHQHYHHYHHHQVLSNTSGNNRKKFPTRTSSLYEISSLYKDLNNDYYDINNDCDNDVYYHPISSIIKSGNHHHHQNNDSNYRILPSSYRTHRQYLLRDTEILPENYPLTDMTSIIGRRSSSVESEKETNTLLATTKTTVTKENFRHNLNNTNTSILREKVYNNSENNEIIGNSNNYNNEYLLSSSSSSSWLRCDDIDSMKEKMKLKTTQQQQQQLLLDKSNSYQHHNCRRYDQKYSELTTNRNRYSESEKDAFNKTTNFDVDNDVSKTRRPGIRTRSESEPNDLCNMKYWVPNNNTEFDIRDEKSSYRKSNNAQRSFIELEEKRQCSSYKLPPKCSSSSRKISTSSPPVTTPRVSIYSCSSRSPRIIRKSPSSRAQTTSTAVTTQNNSQRSKSPNISSRINNNGCSSPRRHYSSNNSSAISMTRRCRTKSPSPTYNNKRYESIDGGINSTGVFRKAKSVTPSTRKSEHSTSPQSLPLSNETTSLKCSEKSSQSSVPPLRSAKHEFESDSNNDEDDINDDFEDDFNDDDDDDKQNSSSDSENGYRAHAYVSNFEKSSSTSSFQYSVNSNSILDATINYAPPSCPLVPSLFPNVPPYLAFSTDSEKGPQLPQQVHKILKWKLTTIMPKVVRRILINSGFRLLKKTNDWMGTWGKHMKSPCFRAIRPYQKVNHLPGSFKIGRKDSCWKNLQVQMIKHGKKEFGFMPKTYIIPQDLKMLRKSWPKYAQRNFKWIIKPPASARGTGIKVVNRWSQIPKRKSVIVQRYIERPFLINGSKFDLRLYVLVTSVNPLRVYLYHDGLVRFASVKYSEKSDTLSDRCMHLTNYSINKFSSNYAKNEDVHACHGHKWTIKSLWAFFEKRGVNTNRLWSAFRNLILRTLLAGESAINAMIKLNVESKYNCFELFGFDILLDSELVPWLLEVNISPSLHSELPLDLHVKAPLVQAVLNTALYHIPPKLSMDQQKDLLTRHELQGPLCFDKRLYITYLSRAEKIKHQQFTKKSLEDRDEYLHNILENLTPDDIRCLIITEDELSRSAPLERIFPTQHTHKYLKYTETPRYYNRLLDAWEHKYGKDRLAGINLLKELCQQNLHLDTPPVPMRRPIKIRTRTLMRRRILTKKSMMTKPSYWSIKIAAMKSSMNKMKRNNSIVSNLQSQIQNSNSTATTSIQPVKQIETINPIVVTTETPLSSASTTTALINFQKQQQQQQPQQQKQT